METIAFLTPYLIHPYSYKTYRELVKNLVARNKSTGLEQSEERVALTRLNWQRMKLMEKKFRLLPELKQEMDQLQAEWHWLVVCESWCGDGAQLVPALAAIAEAAPTITLTVLLRDENLELIDSCLTNGARAIPKLVCNDAATQKRIFTWGPRPQGILKRLEEYKNNNPLASADEINMQLQTWYTEDKGKALQEDLLLLIREARNRENENKDLAGQA